MTVTDTFADVLRGALGADAVPCDVQQNGRDCTMPAAHMVTTRCCGNQTGICNPHLFLLLKYMHTVQCQQCSAEFASFGDAVTWRPI